MGRRLRRSFGWLLVPLVLTACEPYSQINTDFWKSLDRTAYTQLPLSDAWISYPGVSLVLERKHGAVTEQRLLLPNPTSISGDNFILMTSRESMLGQIGRFRPALLIERNDGPPSPFTDFDGQPQNASEDSMGMLFWSQWTNGTDLNCVLGFRRLDATARMTPDKASSIDIMIRNCVRGTAEEAMKPISDVYAGYAAITTPISGDQRLLSPLAGPEP